MPVVPARLVCWQLRELAAGRGRCCTFALDLDGWPLACKGGGRDRRTCGCAAQSTAACSVNDRESPHATLLTARGGHGRAPVCHRLIIGSVEICWHAHDLLVWRW